VPRRDSGTTGRAAATTKGIPAPVRSLLPSPCERARGAVKPPTVAPDEEQPSTPLPTGSRQTLASAEEEAAGCTAKRLLQWSRIGRPSAVPQSSFSPQTSVNRRTPPDTRLGAYVREIACLQARSNRPLPPRSACHAEGRGFESLQPALEKACILQAFFVCAVG
jgi:hypothetical protein